MKQTLEELSAHLKNAPVGQSGAGLLERGEARSPAAAYEAERPSTQPLPPPPAAAAPPTDAAPLQTPLQTPLVQPDTSQAMASLHGNL